MNHLIALSVFSLLKANAFKTVKAKRKLHNFYRAAL